MLKRFFLPVCLWIVSLIFSQFGIAAVGDPEDGKEIFKYCSTCHSIIPGRHLTGPSLAKIFGRQAGSQNDFHRYSPAIKQSKIVWNEESLDRWLTAPQSLIPGNWMNFSGTDNAQTRADIVAYLRQVSNQELASDSKSLEKDYGIPNLKNASPNQTVVGISYCGDAYRLSTSAGDEIVFWEFNLRFKTDSSIAGPNPGKPVLVPAGMRGDRAQLVFSTPEDISHMIRVECK